MNSPLSIGPHPQPRRNGHDPAVTLAVGPGGRLMLKARAPRRAPITDEELLIKAGLTEVQLRARAQRVAKGLHRAPSSEELLQRARVIRGMLG